jgi:hypothetical protein
VNEKEGVDPFLYLPENVYGLHVNLPASTLISKQCQSPTGTLISNQPSDRRFSVHDHEVRPSNTRAAQAELPTADFDTLRFLKELDRYPKFAIDSVRIFGSLASRTSCC